MTMPSWASVQAHGIQNMKAIGQACSSKQGCGVLAWGHLLRQSAAPAPWPHRGSRPCLQHPDQPLNALKETSS